MRKPKHHTIKTQGAFDIVDFKGCSIRPTGRKDCALVAILALTPSHRQTRIWLQEKLWGDRGPEQSAASLRQALTTLRGILNRDGEIIRADRTWVWLEADAVHLDCDDLSDRSEVLRGFDLREEGFNEWLREQRSVKPSAKLCLSRAFSQERANRRWYMRASSRALEDIQVADTDHSLIDGLLESLSTIGIRSIVDTRDNQQFDDPRPTDLVTTISTSRFYDDGLISVVVNSGFGVLQWQIRREVSFRTYVSLKQVLTEIIQQFQDFAIKSEAAALSHDCWSAYTDGCNALMGVLVPGSMPLQDVKRLSEAAIYADEQGLYHALLGQAQLLIHGERERLTPLDVDEVMGSFRTAVGLSPANGLVLALAGHSYGFFMGDLQRNDALTAEAVRLLPGSGACWIYRTISLTYNGRYSEAVDAAKRAVILSRGTMIFPMARSAQLFARLMFGDARGAIQSGEDALDGIFFRPAVVDLMTAYSLMGRLQEGREKLKVLKSREPSLSIDLLRSPDYPIVNAFHRSQIVDAASKLGLH